MATVYMNGFEWNTMLENILTNQDASITTDYKRSGNYSMYLWWWYAYTRIGLPTPISEMYFQVAYYFSGSLPVVNEKFLYWGNNTTNLGNLTRIDSQQVSVNLGDTTNGIILSNKRIGHSRWFLFELYVKLGDASNGVISLRMNGIDEGTYYGNTIPGSISTINTLTFRAPQVATYIDDIIVNDTSGEFNNSWPNGSKIVLIRPWARGSENTWDAYSTTPIIDNYECVDQDYSAEPDQYIYTDRVGDVDLYKMQNLPPGLTNVSVVRSDMWAMRSSGTMQSITHALKPPGITYYTTSVYPLSTIFELYTSMWQYNPTTGEAWQPDEIANIEAGVKSVTAISLVPVLSVNITITANSVYVHN